MKKTLVQYFSSHTLPYLDTVDRAHVYRNFLEKRQKTQQRSWIKIYKAITYAVCTIVVINTIRFGDFFGLFPQQYPQEESQHVVAQTIGKITEHK